MMLKYWHKIIIGITLLITFMYTGIPFEIGDPFVESIFRVVTYLIVFMLLYYVYTQTSNVINQFVRVGLKGLLGGLFFLFVIGAMWNIFVERNWSNMEIYTNESGTKILKQMRETSGSIYDYRDRLVIYEFDENNRISINSDVRYFDGPWTVVDVMK